MIEIEKFVTMDLDQVCAYELEHLDTMCEKLSTARLCDYIGKAIIAEYGFKGSKDEVIAQLNDMFEKYVNSFSEEDRQELIQRKQKYNEFFTTGNKFEDEAVLKLIRQYKNNMEGEGISKIMVTTGDFKMMANILHEEKMCLCYNNH